MCRIPQKSWKELTTKPKFKIGDYVSVDIADVSAPAILNNMIWNETFGYWNCSILIYGKPENEVDVDEDWLKSVSEKEYIIMRIMDE